ncbi:hypothetical protein MUN88_04640 [Gracilibacillus caseinilyticus]|uniref:5,10-methylene-tetrahydrofolate dehydrogenase n=1 Tax=Gracilibacillus caseinilyticus TaxID=2932256 RepID=A0ABY4EZW5_9BACI|nr:hypothetical protein [Gracilibacillus caseinilyticus]UOQ49398.1 hypothetical protein MUN88_04640 [Gracilibacillus caseinilyticus]
MKEHRCTLGFVTPPWYTEKIEYKLQHCLPELLNKHLDGEQEWEVKYSADPLIGLTEHSKEVMNALYRKKEEEGWDFAVCLTDLPLFRNKSLVVAEANEKKQVSLLSLPGIGAFPIIKRIRESIIQLVKEMNGENTQKEPGRWSLNASRNKWKNVWRKLTFMTPILKETTEIDDENMGVRFIVDSRFRAGLRMITGMVRANRPWLLFPSFMKVLMVAFTTGIYALVFPTLWKLGGSYGIGRMLLISVMAITSLVLWIIISHKLWERPHDNYSTYLRRLYNCTTFLTLLTTIVIYYFVLYGGFLLAVFLLIPMDVLQAQLSGEGDFRHYFLIAWMATNVSTFIGALGSSLEKEEVVLSGTYGYRQRQRYELIKESKEKHKQQEGKSAPSIK